MTTPVKRRYRSPQREARAARTRAAVLEAARDLFLERGYAATAVADVASRARVNVDTVYSAAGRKPQLLLAVVDMVLGDSDRPLPAEERGYVRDVRAAPTATEKLQTYATALARLMPLLSPLFAALREAGLTDPECARVHQHLTDRRAANMRLLAADLRESGGLRQDLDDDTVADLLWSTNAPEWFALVTSRGWDPERYAATLADLWCRVLLA